MIRKPWDEYFMDIAYAVATRSTCKRRQVGAVVVSSDNRILGTGYNGALPGTPHCDETGCLRERLNIPSGQRQEICRAQHAEANVCNIAAKYGTSLKGSTMYVTTQPCVTCMKAMITSGIVKIVYDGEYPDKLSLDIAKEAGIKLQKYYKYQEFKDDRGNVVRILHNDGTEEVNKYDDKNRIIYNEFHGVVTKWEYRDDVNVYKRIDDGNGYREILTNLNGQVIYDHKISYC